MYKVKKISTLYHLLSRIRTYMAQNCLDIVTSILRLDRHDIDVLIKFKTHLYEEYYRFADAPEFCRQNNNLDLLEIIINWTEAQINILIQDQSSKRKKKGKNKIQHYVNLIENQQTIDALENQHAINLIKKHYNGL